MACFIVPAAEAVVTTVISKAAEKKEHDLTQVEAIEKNEVAHKPHRMSFVRKLHWLSNMLWGGAALLLFEHLWHGEVVPFPPFLTAVSDPASTSEMLGEMSTAGVAMAALITAVWGGMVIVTGIIEKRAEKDPATSQEV